VSREQDGRLQQNLDAIARLSHRGPDNLGHLRDGEIFLGHARLSILDLNEAANQPFRDEEHALVFNGEIYNYLPLRAARLANRSLRTTSDTEVLFGLLKELGEACLPLLDGMFALAFWDRARGRLLLARDTVGIKPLYWRKTPDGLEFASEIKSLDCRPALAPLREILAHGHVEDGLLPWEGVRELAPGHLLEYDVAARRVRTAPFTDLRRYVRPERCAELAARGDLVDQLDQLLNDSVAMHLQSDAPVGSLCSGGVDSTLVSALAVRQQRDVRLYHAGVEGGGGEETFAQQASAHLGIPIVYTKMTREEFWRVFPRVTWHSDLPVYHPNDIPLYCITRRAREDGVKVMLTGEGADELFGGYTWHRRFRDTLARYRQDRLRHPLLAKVSRRLWSMFDYRGGLGGFDAADFISHAPLGPAYSAQNLELDFRGQAILTQEFRAWRRWMECLDTYAGAVPPVDAPVLSFILYNMYGHLGTILHRTDRMLMANSIEGRVPFLENDLFEFGLNLPLREKIRGRQGKDILKRVARRYLPHRLVYRRKAGFPVPWTQYLPRRVRLLEDGFVSSWTGLTTAQLAPWIENCPTMKFRAIALEVWGRIFVFGQDWQGLTVE
jgi:asparagine synthase (glutamine-hydrolysing)